MVCFFSGTLRGDSLKLRKLPFKIFASQKSGLLAQRRHRNEVSLNRLDTERMSLKH